MNKLLKNSLVRFWIISYLVPFVVFFIFDEIGADLFTTDSLGWSLLIGAAWLGYALAIYHLGIYLKRTGRI